MNRAKRKARQAGNKQKSRDTDDNNTHNGMDDVEKKIKIEVKEESTSSCGTAIIALYYFVFFINVLIYNYCRNGNW